MPSPRPRSKRPARAARPAVEPRRAELLALRRAERLERDIQDATRRVRRATLKSEAALLELGQFLADRSRALADQLAQRTGTDG